MTIQEKIASWLNGSKEYFLGVVYYSRIPGCDEALLAVLREGPNPYRIARLQKELYGYLQAGIEVKKVEKKPAVNPKLYDSCIAAAHEAYKKVMNTRAVLFAMIPSDDHINPNQPDMIRSRSPLALEIVDAWKQVSYLYDRARYVKQYGRLPDTSDDENENADAIPPQLVKQSLDNARKAFNKLKKKEATPERVALMQQHEEKIKTLEKRWLSLKPNK